MNQGILYVATNQELIEEAKVSASRVRSVMNGTPIGIVTDGPEPDEFDIVISLDSPSYGFEDKIKGMIKTPFKKTIFFDTDIYLLNSIYDIFEILDNFDIAATHNHNRDLYSSQSLCIPDSFPEYSSGVLAFDKKKTKNLFNKWLSIYSPDHLGDQPAFRKALYESEVRIATLPREYNYYVRYPGHVVKEINILHGRLLDIDTQGATKNIDINRIANVYSGEDGHRLFAPDGYQLWPQKIPTIKLKQMLRKDGLIKTIHTGVIKVLKSAP